jgi:DNA repair protein SbcD/Mre11
MPTFLHAADLHLDSPLRGLSNRDAALGREVRNATRAAFEQLIDRALVAKVRFAVFSGDLFDGTHQSVDTALFLNGGLRRLVDAAIPVFLIRGNHDHLGQTSSVVLPKGVYQLAHARPETIVRADLGVAIHGQSFGEQNVTIDLTERYPQPTPGLFNVGLLHTALEGNASGHVRYAPTSPGRLASLGYGYWALGHVHDVKILREGDITMAYSGNLQGRHANETGKKGALLVSYEGTKLTSVEPFSCDVVRWFQVIVELSPRATAHEQARSTAAAVADQTREARAEGRACAVRLTLRGASPELVRNSAEDVRSLLVQALVEACGDRVWIEKLSLEEPGRPELPTTLRGPLDQVLTRLEGEPVDDEAMLFAREMWQRVIVAIGREEAAYFWADQFSIRSLEELRALVIARGRERVFAQLGEG